MPKKVLCVIDHDFDNKIPSFFSPEQVICVKKGEVTEEMLNEATAVVGNLSADKVNKMPHLEYLHAESAGVNQYAGIIPSHITMTCSSGCYGHAMSEHMVAAVFYFYRMFGYYVRNQRMRRWRNEGHVDSVEGSTCLVVGLGDIGKAFAKRMKAMGCKIIGIKRNIHEKPDYVDELTTLDHLNELLPTADIIAMCLPDTPNTKQVLSEDNLRLCKKNAVLINVGRGVNIDSTALVSVLDEGWFKGVQLDVVDPEPLPFNNKLWSYENVLITPHISGGYNMPQTLEKVINLAIRNIDNYLNDRPLENLVSHTEGYRINND
ncbi:MAG: D-2-hydroxyacid dehydrogenase [Erysipelotrichaceae bacterium]|nr:D-2-hydroxyacid dehydrogenase [Erysipelotrichaceae bacterium]